MTLRPALEFVLRHGDNAVTLRASLRAATELDRIAEGFGPLVVKIAGGDLGSIKAAIRAAATDRAAADAYLASTENKPLSAFLDDAQAACLALVAAVLPTAEPAESRTRTTSSTAKAKPWREHFADLYGFGTGWLGWTPEAVWNASPDELTAGFEAHAKRLVAMNGGSDDDTAGTDEEQRQANIAEGLDPDFDRQGLRALKAKMSR